MVILSISLPCFAGKANYVPYSEIMYSFEYSEGSAWHDLALTEFYVGESFYLIFNISIVYTPSFFQMFHQQEMDIAVSFEEPVKMEVIPVEGPSPLVIDPSYDNLLYTCKIPVHLEEVNADGNPINRHVTTIIFKCTPKTSGKQTIRLLYNKNFVLPGYNKEISFEIIGEDSVGQFSNGKTYDDNINQYKMDGKDSSDKLFLEPIVVSNTAPDWFDSWDFIDDESFKFLEYLFYNDNEAISIETESGIVINKTNDNKFIISLPQSIISESSENQGKNLLFTQKDNSLSFYLDINNYHKMKELFPILADPNVEIYMADYSHGLSKSDYLDMLSYLMGEDNTVSSNSSVILTLEVPGTITSCNNCTQTSNNTIEYCFPLIDFLLLENPLSFSVTWN